MASMRLAGLQNLIWKFLFGPFGRVFPFRLAGVPARMVAVMAWAFGLRRDVTQKNLALAMPELSRASRERIARASYLSVATTLFELPVLRHLSDDSLRQSIVFDNIELLYGLEGRGGLLLSAHFGNWELLALAAGYLSGVPFSIVVKEQSDFGQLDRMRTCRGNRVIATSKAAREATSILRSGGVIAMLADQSAPIEDVEVEMFGIPTHTYSTPARLALRYRPRAIIGFAVRGAAGRYRVRLDELRHDDLDDNADGIREFTRRYARALEAIVREHPEQWLWQHRKWKNTVGVEYL